MSDKKIILPGIPREPDETAGVALPMMRGFSCPVAAPFLGGQDGPPEGIGTGWSNVAGKGIRFFVSVHAEGGFALVAHLDYAHYVRLCQNLASVGQQAMLTGDLETRAEDDPLAALAVAHEALEHAEAKFLFYEQSHRAKGTADADAKAEVNKAMAAEMAGARTQVAKALRIEEEQR